MIKRVKILISVLTLAVLYGSFLSAQDLPVPLEPDQRLDVEELILEGDILDLAVPYVDSRGLSGILNNTDRTIVAIRGSYDFQLLSGGIKVIPWNFFLSDPLAKQDRLGLAAGNTLTLPPTIDPSGKDVPYLNLKVTGLVCSDGAYAGADGPFLRRSFLARAKARIAQLLEAKKLLEESSEEEFFEMLSGKDPFVTGREAWVIHTTLQGMLMNPERTALRPDCHQILDSNLTRLEAL
jgi:hypothetical protein